MIINKMSKSLNEKSGGGLTLLNLEVSKLNKKMKIYLLLTSILIILSAGLIFGQICSVSSCRSSTRGGSDGGSTSITEGKIMYTDGSLPTQWKTEDEYNALTPEEKVKYHKASSRDFQTADISQLQDLFNNDKLDKQQRLEAAKKMAPGLNIDDNSNLNGWKFENGNLIRPNGNVAIENFAKETLDPNIKLRVLGKKGCY